MVNQGRVQADELVPGTRLAEPGARQQTHRGGIAMQPTLINVRICHGKSPLRLHCRVRQQKSRNFCPLKRKFRDFR